MYTRVNQQTSFYGYILSYIFFSLKLISFNVYSCKSNPMQQLLFLKIDQTLMYTINHIHPIFFFYKSINFNIANQCVHLLLRIYSFVHLFFLKINQFQCVNTHVNQTQQLLFLKIDRINQIKRRFLPIFFSYKSINFNTANQCVDFLLFFRASFFLFKINQFQRTLVIYINEIKCKSFFPKKSIKL